MELRTGGANLIKKKFNSTTEPNKRFHLTAYRSVFGDCAPAKAFVGGVSLAVPAASETQALGGIGDLFAEMKPEWVGQSLNSLTSINKVFFCSLVC